MYLGGAVNRERTSDRAALLFNDLASIGVPVLFGVDVARRLGLPCGDSRAGDDYTFDRRPVTKGP